MAVFQEGYYFGFGADGDHLKTAEEVKMAINHRFAMINLDCSDRIDNSINKFSESEVGKRYLQLEKPIRKELERKYLNKTFTLGQDVIITFEEVDFKKVILIYLVQYYLQLRYIMI